MRGRVTKCHAERIHAKRRAEERYGVTLNKHDYKEISKSIMRGEQAVLKRQSLARTIYLIDYQGQQLKAVYDKKRHQVVTFLPIEEDFKLLGEI